MFPESEKIRIIKNENTVSGLIFLENMLHDKPEKFIRIAKKIYPQAAAYLKAKEYSRSYFPAKSFLGQRAAEHILAGEDFSRVIDNMRQAWRLYVQMHTTVVD
jgi:hypothetical protein